MAAGSARAQTWHPKFGRSTMPHAAAVSPSDAAQLDASPLDSSPLDASPLDASPLDASPPDASSVSRRALFATAGGLAGAAAMAPAVSLAQTAQMAASAQAPAAAPQMPAVQAPVRSDWLARRTEAIIEPGLPIIDPHHHLWDAPRYRYMFPELLADLGTGHNIAVTMYEQAREMYRAEGPEELKSLGETEFITG